MKKAFLIFLPFAVLSILIKDAHGFSTYRKSRSTLDRGCNIVCPSDFSNDSPYEIGKVYTYQYETDVVTKMEGASDQESKFSTSLIADIRPLSPCEFVLSVTSSDSQELSTAAVANDLTFSFINGEIREICSAETEPTWTLNIKKGILSSFQHSALERVTERDIMGDCATSYVGLGGSSFLKTKDMKTCSNGHKLYQYSLNLPDIPIQKLPLIDTSYECTSQIEESKVLSQMACEIQYKFRPFSSEKSGAVTIENTKLSLTSSSEARSAHSISGSLKKSTSLLYEHQDFSTKDSLFLEEKTNFLLSAISKLEDYEKPESFSELINLLRQMEYSQLVHFFYKIEDPVKRNIVMDTIPLLKTQSGITLMRDIIQSGSLSNEALDKWYFSFSHYKNPTLGIISIISSLLTAQPRNSALIGISTMIQTFCESHEDCDTMLPVQTVVKKFESLIGDNCEAFDSFDESRVILALRGLSNVRFLSSPSRIALKNCYKEKTNSMFIRVAALKVYKSISCDTEDARHLKETFADREEDSELRIGAYSAFMSCPTAGNIDFVKDILISEPVNQVGSYVWTHLTNIQESQNVEKENLKILIGDEFLENKWKTDVRKFSRYFEMTRYSKDLDLGSTVDGDVIFSQDSYMPRSASLNMSLNVFGQPIDFLRMEGRAEGFEPFVEELFSSKGYFKEDSIHKLLTGLRNKRDATFTNSMETDPKGNYFLNIFGKDIQYGSFDSKESLLRQLSNILPFSSKSPLDHDINYSHSSILLDGKVVVPMLSGFPLSLSVKGSSTFSLKSNLAINLDSWSEGTSHIMAQIYPTASVQINGVMSVDGHFSKTGLRSTSHMHATSNFDAKVEFDKAKGLKMSVNVPKESVKFLDVSVNFFLLDKENEYVPLISQNPRSEYVRCTPSFMNDVLGVKFCGVSSYHYVEGSTDGQKSDMDVYFSGPSTFSIGYSKTDNFNQYILDCEFSSDQTSNKIMLAFDTPGSKIIDRLSNLTLLYDNTQRSYSMDLAIPYKSTKISAAFSQNDKKLYVNGQIQFENKALIVIKQVLAIENKGRYDFLTKIVYKNDPVIDWYGGATLQDQRMSIDAQLKSSYHEKIKLSGSLELNEVGRSISLVVDSRPFHSNTRVSIKTNDAGVNMKANIVYRLFDSPENHIQTDGSYKFSQSGALRKHDVSLRVNPSMYPSLNSEILWNVQLSDNYIENNIIARAGNTSYIFEQQLSSRSSMEIEEFIFKLMASTKPGGEKYGLAIIHHASASKMHNQFEVAFDKKRRFNIYHERTISLDPLELKWHCGLEASDKYVYRIGVDLEESESDGNIKGSTLLQWRTDEKIESNILFQRQNRGYVDYALTADIIMPDKSLLALNGTILVSNKESVLRFRFVDFNNKEWDAKLVLLIPHIDDIELSGNLKIGDKMHTGYMLLKNKHGKRELTAKIPQVGFLAITSKENMKHITGIMEWDDKSISDWSFEGKTLQNEVVLSLTALGYDAHMRGKLENSGLQVRAKWNEMHCDIRGRFNVSPSLTEVHLEFHSPYKPLSDIALIFMHKNEPKQFNSKVVVRWNEREFHITNEGSHVDENGFVKLRTRSSEAILDGIEFNFSQENFNKTTHGVKLYFKHARKALHLDLEQSISPSASMGKFKFLGLPVDEELSGNYEIIFKNDKSFNYGFSINSLRKELKYIKMEAFVFPSSLRFNFDTPYGPKIDGNFKLEKESFRAAGYPPSYYPDNDKEAKDVKQTILGYLNLNVTGRDYRFSSKNVLNLDQNESRLELLQSWREKGNDILNVFNFLSNKDTVELKIKSPCLSYDQLILNYINNEEEHKMEYSIALNDKLASITRKSDGLEKTSFILVTPVGEGRAEVDNTQRGSLISSTFKANIFESNTLDGTFEIKENMCSLKVLVNNNMSLQGRISVDQENSYKAKVSILTLDGSVENNILDLNSQLKILGNGEYNFGWTISNKGRSFPLIKGQANIKRDEIKAFIDIPKADESPQQYVLSGKWKSLKSVTLKLESKDRLIGELDGGFDKKNTFINLDLPFYDLSRHEFIFSAIETSDSKIEVKSLLKSSNHIYCDIAGQVELSMDEILGSFDINFNEGVYNYGLEFDVGRESDTLLSATSKVHNKNTNSNSLLINLVIKKDALNGAFEVFDGSYKLKSILDNYFKSWTISFNDKGVEVFKWIGSIKDTKILSEISLLLENNKQWNSTIDISKQAVDIQLNQDGHPCVLISGKWEKKPFFNAEVALYQNFYESSHSFNLNTKSDDEGNYEIKAYINEEKINVYIQTTEESMSLNLDSSYGDLSHLRFLSSTNGSVSGALTTLNKEEYFFKIELPLTTTNAYVEMGLPNNKYFKSEFELEKYSVFVTLAVLDNKFEFRGRRNEEFTNFSVDSKARLSVLGIEERGLTLNIDVINFHVILKIHEAEPLFFVEGKMSEDGVFLNTHYLKYFKGKVDFNYHESFEMSGALNSYKLDFLWESVRPFVGKIRLNLENGEKNLKNVLFYDSSGNDDSFVVNYQLSKESDFFLKAETRFTLTEDTLHGKSLIRSSFAGWEQVMIKVNYNIAVQPKASLVISRNKPDSTKDVIDIKVKFDDYFPTIFITTSFPGFEKLIIKDKFLEAKRGLNKYEITLMKNNEDWLLWSLNYSSRKEMSLTKFSFESNLTGYALSEPLRIDVNWDMETKHNAYSFYLKGNQKHHNVSFRLEVDLEDKSFEISIETPFKNYEKLSIIGMSDTTSIGKSIGIQFERDRVKRELSLNSFDEEDGTRNVILKSPFKELESISVKMKRDADSPLKFSFESSGNYLAAIGVKFDFSTPLKCAELKVKFDTSDYHARTEFAYDQYLKKVTLDASFPKTKVHWSHGIYPEDDKMHTDLNMTVTYKNTFFKIKRKTLTQSDSNGVFSEEKVTLSSNSKFLPYKDRVSTTTTKVKWSKGRISSIDYNNKVLIDKSAKFVYEFLLDVTKDKWIFKTVVFCPNTFRIDIKGKMNDFIEGDINIGDDVYKVEGKQSKDLVLFEVKHQSQSVLKGEWKAKGNKHSLTLDINEERNFRKMLHLSLHYDVFPFTNLNLKIVENSVTHVHTDIFRTSTPGKEVVTIKTHDKQGLQATAVLLNERGKYDFRLNGTIEEVDFELDLAFNKDNIKVIASTKEIRGQYVKLNFNLSKKQLKLDFKYDLRRSLSNKASLTTEFHIDKKEFDGKIQIKQNENVFLNAEKHIKWDEKESSIRFELTWQKKELLKFSGVKRGNFENAGFDMSLPNFSTSVSHKFSKGIAVTEFKALGFSEELNLKHELKVNSDYTKFDSKFTLNQRNDIETKIKYLINDVISLAVKSSLPIFDGGFTLSVYPREKKFVFSFPTYLSMEGRAAVESKTVKAELKMKNHVLPNFQNLVVKIQSKYIHAFKAAIEIDDKKIKYAQEIKESSSEKLNFNSQLTTSFSMLKKVEASLYFWRMKEVKLKVRINEAIYSGGIARDGNHGGTLTITTPVKEFQKLDVSYTKKGDVYQGKLIFGEDQKINLLAEGSIKTGIFDVKGKFLGSITKIKVSRDGSNSYKFDGKLEDEGGNKLFDVEGSAKIIDSTSEINVLIGSSDTIKIRLTRLNKGLEFEYSSNGQLVGNALGEIKGHLSDDFSLNAKIKALQVDAEMSGSLSKNGIDFSLKVLHDGMLALNIKKELHIGRSKVVGTFLLDHPQLRHLQTDLKVNYQFNTDIKNLNFSLEYRLFNDDHWVHLKYKFLPTINIDGMLSCHIGELLNIESPFSFELKSDKKLTMNARISNNKLSFFYDTLHHDFNIYANLNLKYLKLEPFLIDMSYKHSNSLKFNSQLRSLYDINGAISVTEESMSGKFYASVDHLFSPVEVSYHMDLAKEGDFQFQIKRDKSAIRLSKDRSGRINGFVSQEDLGGYRVDLKNGFIAVTDHSGNVHSVSYGGDSNNDYSLYISSPLLNSRSKRDLGGSYSFNDKTNHRKLTVKTPFEALNNMNINFISDEGKFTLESDLGDAELGISAEYDFENPLAHIKFHGLYVDNRKGTPKMLKINVDYESNKLSFSTSFDKVYSFLFNADYVPEKKFITFVSKGKMEGNMFFDIFSEIKTDSNYLYYRGILSHNIFGREYKFSEKLELKYGKIYVLNYEGSRNDVEEYNIHTTFNTIESGGANLKLDWFVREIDPNNKVVQGDIHLKSKKGNVAIKILGAEAKGDYILKENELVVNLASSKDSSTNINFKIKLNWTVGNNDTPHTFKIAVDGENHILASFEYLHLSWMKVKVQFDDVTQEVNVTLKTKSDKSLSIVLRGKISAVIELKLETIPNGNRLDIRYEDWRLVSELSVSDGPNFLFDIIAHTPIIPTQHIKLLLAYDRSTKNIGANIIIDVYGKMPLLDLNVQIKTKNIQATYSVIGDFDLQIDNVRLSLDTNAKYSPQGSEFHIALSKNDETRYTIKGSTEGISNIKLQITYYGKQLASFAYNLKDMSNNNLSIDASIKIDHEVLPKLNSWRILIETTKSSQGSLFMGDVKGSLFIDGHKTLNIKGARAPSSLSLIISDEAGMLVDSIKIKFEDKKEKFISIEYADILKVKLSFTGEVILIDGKLESTSFEPKKIKFKFQLNREKRTLKGLIESGVLDVKLKAEIKKLSFTNAHFAVVLESNIEALRKLSMSGDWKLEGSSYKGILKNNVNDKHYDIEVEIINQDTFLLHFSSPIPGFESIELDSHIRGDKFDFHSRVGSGENEFKIGCELFFKVQSPKLTFEVYSHSERMLHLELEIELEGNEKSIHIEAGALGNEMKLKAEFEDEEHIEVEMHLPFEHFENVDIDVHILSLTASGAEFRSKIHTSGGDYLSYIKWSATKEKIDLIFKVNSENESQFANLEILIKNEAIKELVIDFKSSFMDPIGLKVKSFIQSLYIENEVTLKYSPISLVPISIETKFGLDKRDDDLFIIKAKANGKESFFDIDCSFSKKKNYMIKSTISLPILKENQFDFHIVIKPIPSDFEFTVSLNRGGKTHELSLSFKSSNAHSKVDLEMKVTLKFDSVEFKLDVGYNGPSNIPISYKQINSSDAIGIRLKLFAKMPSKFLSGTEPFEVKFNFMWTLTKGELLFESNRIGRLETHATWKNRVINGSFSVISYETAFAKSITFSVDLKPKGLFKIKLIHDQNAIHMTMQGDEARIVINRDKRDVFGMTLNENLFSSGILVFRTDSGIHKISYSRPNANSDGNLYLESPLLRHSYISINVDFRDEKYILRSSYGPHSFLISASDILATESNEIFLYSAYRNAESTSSKKSISLNITNELDDIFITSSFKIDRHSSEIEITFPKYIRLDMMANFAFISTAYGKFLSSVKPDSFFKVDYNNYHAHFAWSVEKGSGKFYLPYDELRGSIDLKIGDSLELINALFKTNSLLCPELSLVIKKDAPNSPFMIRIISPIKGLEIIEGFLEFSSKNKSGSIKINCPRGDFTIIFDYTSHRLNMDLSGSTFERARLHAEWRELDTGENKVSLVLESSFPNVENVDVEILFNYEDKAKGSIRWMDEEIDFELYYYLPNLLLHLDVITTIDHFERFSIKTEFDWAYIKTIGFVILLPNNESYGFEYTYYFNSLLDFNVKFGIDFGVYFYSFFPIQRLSLYMLDYEATKSLKCGFSISAREFFRPINISMNFYREGISLNTEFFFENLGNTNFIFAFKNNQTKYAELKIKGALYYQKLYIFGKCANSDNATCEFVITEKNKRAIKLKWNPIFSTLLIEVGDIFDLSGMKLKLALLPNNKGFDGFLDFENRITLDTNVRSNSFKLYWKQGHALPRSVEYRFGSIKDFFLTFSTTDNEKLGIRCYLKDKYSELEWFLPKGFVSIKSKIDKLSLTDLNLTWGKSRGELDTHNGLRLITNKEKDKSEIELIRKAPNVQESCRAYYQKTHSHTVFGFTIEDVLNARRKVAFETAVTTIEPYKNRIDILTEIENQKKYIYGEYRLVFVNGGFKGHLEIKTPGDRYSLIVTKTSLKEGFHVVDLRADRERNEVMSISAEIEPYLIKVHRFQIGGQDSLNGVAGLTNETSIVLNVNGGIEVNGTLEEEGSVLVVNGIFKEVQSLFSRPAITPINFDDSDYYHTFFNETRRSWTTFFQDYTRQLTSLKDPFAIAHAYSLLKEEAQHITNEKLRIFTIKQMNYIESLCSSWKRDIDEMILSMEDLVLELNEALLDTIQLLFDQFFCNARKLSDTLIRCINSEMSLNQIEDWKSELILLANKGLSIYKVYIREPLREIISLISEISKEITTDLAETAKVLKKLKVLKDVFKLYVEYQSWLEEIHFTARMREIFNGAIKYLRVISERLRELKKTATRWTNKVMRIIKESYAALEDNFPVFGYVASNLVLTVSKVISPSIVSFDPQKIFDSIAGKTEMFISLAYDLVNVDHLMQYEFTYDSESFRYVQKLPFRWKKFSSPPVIFDFVFGREEEEIDKNLLLFQNMIIESSKAFKNFFSIDLLSLIPPFSGSGLIIGNGGIVTFDKKVYEVFPQNCSYILTTDFLHGKFEVLVNYENGIRKSITVKTEEGEIVIDTLYFKKVTYNGRTMELPLSLGRDTFIYQVSELTIAVRNDMGLKMECNGAYNYCSITVSGWHTGRVGGLLGVYDKEPFNDWMLRNRSISSNGRGFLSSWSPNGDCSNAEILVDVKAPKEVKICKDLFYGSHSALYPCFERVNPQPFYEFCTHNIRKIKNTIDKTTGYCPIASAYVSHCRIKEIDLWIPSSCATCLSTNNAQIMEVGEFFTLEDNDGYKSVDVAFLVDINQKCPSKLFKNLPYLLEASFKKRNITQSRYAVVGYGGGKHLRYPRTYTAGGKIFTSSRHIYKAFNNLMMKQKINRWGFKNRGDVFEALKFAIKKLDYRPEISKTIILIHCDDRDPNKDGSFFGDALIAIKNKGIVVHRLLPGGFNLKISKYSKTRREEILGYDSRSVILSRHGRHSALKRYLNIPKDYVSTLASDSGGVVFNSEAFNKKKLHYFTDYVAESSNPPQCQECNCLSNRDGVGKVKCHQCIKPTLNILFNNLIKI